MANHNPCGLMGGSRPAADGQSCLLQLVLWHGRRGTLFLPAVLPVPLPMSKPQPTEPSPPLLLSPLPPSLFPPTTHHTKPHRTRGYRNPEFFKKMIEHYDIEQYGSCLPREVWDPAALPAEDYLHALKKAADEARRHAERERAATGRIEFVRGGSEAAQRGPPRQAAGATGSLAAAQARAAAIAAAAAIARRVST